MGDRVASGWSNGRVRRVPVAEIHAVCNPAERLGSQASSDIHLRSSPHGYKLTDDHTVSWIFKRVEPEREKSLHREAETVRDA